MRKFWIVCGVLTVSAALCVAAGFAAPAMLLYQAFVVYYRARSQRGRAWFLVTLAFAGALLTTGSPFVGALFFLVALTGLTLGEAVRRQVSLGVTVVFATFSAFAVLVVHEALTWSVSREAWSDALAVYVTQIEQLDATDANAAVIATLTWLNEEWPYLAFGLMFSAVLLCEVILLSTMYKKLSGEGVVTVHRGGFMCVRVPEHLVWLAIAMAGLWFLDRRWQVDPVRFIAWNSAVALAVVYWLNGLAVLLFALHAMQVRSWVVFVFFLSAFALSFHHMFAFVGLFDTWVDFRLRVGRFVLSRSDASETGDDKPD